MKFPPGCKQSVTKDWAGINLKTELPKIIYKKIGSQLNFAEALKAISLEINYRTNEQPF